MKQRLLATIITALCGILLCYLISRWTDYSGIIVGILSFVYIYFITRLYSSVEDEKLGYKLDNIERILNAIIVLAVILYNVNILEKIYYKDIFTILFGTVYFSIVGMQLGLKCK